MKIVRQEQNTLLSFLLILSWKNKWCPVLDLLLLWFFWFWLDPEPSGGQLCTASLENWRAPADLICILRSQLILTEAEQQPSYKRGCSHYSVLSYSGADRMPTHTQLMLPLDCVESLLTGFLAPCHSLDWNLRAVILGPLDFTVEGRVLLPLEVRRI